MRPDRISLWWRDEMTRLYAGLAALIAVLGLGFMGWKAFLGRPDELSPIMV